MSDGNTAESVGPARELDASSFTAPARSDARAAATNPHVCVACAGDLVYPLDWEPTPDRRWTIRLRCPECEYVSVGVFDQVAADRLDEELDHATEQILDDLNTLARANALERVERFVAALDADHILAEDF